MDPRPLKMTQFPPSASATSGSPDALLTVDLGALTANMEAYRRLAHGAEVAGVVKADAYGLGLAPVARAMAAVGCSTFFVTDVVEGAALRALLPGAVIYLTNGLPPGAGPAAREAGLRPCLGSLAEVDAWIAESRIAGRPLSAALHFDTGMNRLGFDGVETERMIRLESCRKELEIELVMSHLACADEPAHPLNALQLSRFLAVASAFPGVPRSLANSAGVLLGGDYCFDLVRPGYAIYGGNPLENGPSPVVPVARAQARVLQVRDVSAEDAAGYGATWQAVGPRRLATLSMGYADGYFRALGSNSGAARVFVGGGFAPVAGRISMDLMMVDITDLPPDAVRRGDMAELIGPHISLEEVAAHADTIGYEVLTSLGDRYTRHYTGAAMPAES